MRGLKTWILQYVYLIYAWIKKVNTTVRVPNLCVDQKSEYYNTCTQSMRGLKKWILQYVYPIYAWIKKVNTTIRVPNLCVDQKSEYYNTYTQSILGCIIQICNVGKSPKLQYFDIFLYLAIFIQFNPPPLFRTCLCSNCCDHISQICHVFTRLFSLNSPWYFLSLFINVTYDIFSTKTSICDNIEMLILRVYSTIRFGFSKFSYFWDITLQLFKQLCVAKDHWWRFSTRNA